jgi:cytochrome c1
MALPQPQQVLCQFTTMLILAYGLTAFQSCQHTKKVYKSDCDIDVNFRKVSFAQLVDSLSKYDQQYVEVTGKYEEDKELSALFNDNMYTNNTDANAIWVNFSQDCPLYLSGTHQGLFEYNDGQFTQINNKLVTIRGRVDMHNRGSHGRCKATIDRISLLKL